MPTEAGHRVPVAVAGHRPEAVVVVHRVPVAVAEHRMPEAVAGHRVPVAAGQRMPEAPPDQDLRLGSLHSYYIRPTLAAYCHNLHKTSFLHLLYK